MNYQTNSVAQQSASVIVRSLVEFRLINTSGQAVDCGSKLQIKTNNKAYMTIVNTRTPWKPTTMRLFRILILAYSQTSLTSHALDGMQVKTVWNNARCSGCKSRCWLPFYQPPTLKYAVLSQVWTDEILWRSLESHVRMRYSDNIECVFDAPKLFSAFHFRR